MQITISGVLQCLDNGMSREEIATHYGVSIKEMREHFKHPKLKGRKRKEKVEMVATLVDDTENLDVSNPVDETEPSPFEEGAEVVDNSEVEDTIWNN
jgi:hypothetical protein